MPIRDDIEGRALPREADESIDAVDIDDADEKFDGAATPTFGVKKCGGRSKKAPPLAAAGGEMDAGSVVTVEEEEERGTVVVTEKGASVEEEVGKGAVFAAEAKWVEATQAAVKSREEEEEVGGKRE